MVSGSRSVVDEPVDGVDGPAARPESEADAVTQLGTALVVGEHGEAVAGTGGTAARTLRAA
jgi:hypothetical protein